MILRNGIVAEIHDKDVLPFLHCYAGFRLADVVLHFLLGCTLEKLVLTHPVAEVQKGLVAFHIVFTGRVIVQAVPP